MIRLIIVDDEETTRDSLMELVPWIDLGVDACRVAKNGVEALEIASVFPPSILLCDVKMPKMDGIELSKRVRVAYPDCGIVFLSGYSDKEYLKTAIKVNAVDYLEKPVDLAELKAIITHIVHDLNRKSEESATMDKLKDSLDANLPLIRQRFLKSLLSGNQNEESYDTSFAHDLFRTGPSHFFIVVTVLINWRNTIKQADKAITESRLQNELTNLNRIGDKETLAGFTDESCWVAIVRFDQVTASVEARQDQVPDSPEAWQDQVTVSLDSLPDALKSLSLGDFTFSIGVSKPVLEPEDLPIAYQESQAAANRQFYEGSNRVHYPVSLPDKQFDLNKTMYARFKKSLFQSSNEEATALLTALSEQILQYADPDVRKIKNVYFTLLMLILDVTLQRGSLPGEEGSENNYVWQDVDSQVTLRGLHKFLHSHLRLVFRKSGDRDATRSKTNEVLTYINDHFLDNQLSIQSIAETVNLSQTYLCALFKKSTGQTLNEYITGLRIERAKELILENKLRLYEVAEIIGLTDVNYFSTLFKRHVGWTPSEYREKMQHDKKGDSLFQ